MGRAIEGHSWALLLCYCLVLYLTDDVFNQSIANVWVNLARCNLGERRHKSNRSRMERGHIPEGMRPRPRIAQLPVHRQLSFATFSIAALLHSFLNMAKTNNSCPLSLSKWPLPLVYSSFALCSIELANKLALQILLKLGTGLRAGYISLCH